jgi:hypothetical protein
LKGKPLYFAKTSGTTGAKYIPFTKESMPYHIEAARNAIYTYMKQVRLICRRKNDFSARKSCSGRKHGIKFGRLSGIVAHFIPKYTKNRMPSWETNCIEDWETKIDAIVEETFDENMTITGIPSWVQMYFERLQQKEGKTGEIFKNFNLLFMGVNFEPYEPNLKFNRQESG